MSLATQARNAADAFGSRTLLSIIRRLRLLSSRLRTSTTQADAQSPPTPVVHRLGMSRSSNRGLASDGDEVVAVTPPRTEGTPQVVQDMVAQFRKEVMEEVSARVGKIINANVHKIVNKLGERMAACWAPNSTPAVSSGRSEWSTPTLRRTQSRRSSCRRFGRCGCSRLLLHPRLRLRLRVPQRLGPPLGPLMNGMHYIIVRRPD